MGLVDDIKNQAKKIGANKGKIMYFRENEKVRVRFLVDLEDGIKLAFHDSFKQGINVPCQDAFGRDCPYCGNDDLRTREMYVWPVWDYDAEEVKIILQAVSQCSPIAALASMYENYGTIVDRDYIIQKTGKGTSTTYAVVPLDKSKFRNTKAKALSESAMLKIIDKAFPADDSNDDDDYSPKSKSKKPASKAKSRPEPKEDDESEYDDMSVKELYIECKSRGITCQQKKPANYYISLLEDYDEEQDDEDDEEDYSEMDAKSLFQLCKKRDIECLKAKPAKYYIKLLEEDDAADDDWNDEDEEDDDDWD
jgi:hypothetical protein